MNYVAFNTPDGEEFLKAITKLRDASEVAEFFSDLFTPAEARTFIARWRTAVMLADKVPYMEIQKSTGQSSATVARVSQSLQFGTGALRKVIERLGKRR